MRLTTPAADGSGRVRALTVQTRASGRHSVTFQSAWHVCLLPLFTRTFRLAMYAGSIAGTVLSSNADTSFEKAQLLHEPGHVVYST